MPPAGEAAAAVGAAQPAGEAVATSEAMAVGEVAAAGSALAPVASGEAFPLLTRAPRQLEAADIAGTLMETVRLIRHYEAVSALDALRARMDPSNDGGRAALARLRGVSYHAACAWLVAMSKMWSLTLPNAAYWAALRRHRVISCMPVFVRMVTCHCGAEQTLSMRTHAARSA